MATPTFRNPAMAMLADQQVRYAPPAQRRVQRQRAWTLLTETDPAKVYPYQFVCYRVTDFRTDAYPDLRIEGGDLAHDLRLLIDGIDQTLAAPIDGESLTLDAAAARLGVSTKTVRRWVRQHRVPTFRAIAGGRRCVAVAAADVARFAADHAATAEKGRAFNRLSDAERERLIRAARAHAARGAGLTETSRLVAGELGRAVETVRAAVRNFDRRHPALAVFPTLTGPLDGPTKQLIYSSFHRGIAVDTLAKSFGRTRTTVYRTVNAVRAERLLQAAPDYITHDSFDDPKQADAILAPMPGRDAWEAARNSMKVPKDVPAELASLYSTPLLTKEQEQHQFRKMNFLRHQLRKVADRFRKADGTIDGSKVRAGGLEQIEQLHAEANAVKDMLIACNMRLVVSIAKRHGAQADNFFELLSDGNMSLMRAVEKFDYSRGNKFSTYASWAIMKNFARSIPEAKTHRERYVTGREELFDATPNARSDEAELVSTAAQAATRVNRLLEYLDPREQAIIRMRAGLDNAQNMTLEEIGKQLGITKERVRQLNVRIMKKLRDIAGEQRLDVP